MATVEQIRRRIAGAIEAAGDGPIGLATELEIERNYIRDYLKGKKRSLRPEVLIAISDKYSIPINDLLVKKQKQNKRRAG